MNDDEFNKKSHFINIIFSSRRNRRNPLFYKLNYIIFLLIFIHLIFFISITEERQKNFMSFSSEIYILINRIGDQKILSESFYLEPSKVFVNGINKDSCKMSCGLENEDNNVKLIFDEILNSTDSMFSG